VTRRRPALFRWLNLEDVIISFAFTGTFDTRFKYRDPEEIMAERKLSVDHVTIWHWVQRYASVLNQRISREMRHPNRSTKPT
jgi:transposase-like protein